ncbi:hypothetical protein [uncultured Pseudonocardia sp.]|uniref:hypothetical protein n=1 Tax=uncultured Pseudonocardia sp. TaxID=211455 RepID=UPI00263471FE|nr:hypothetical protein [uncultured Pseudonocardia sp.]
MKRIAQRIAVLGVILAGVAIGAPALAFAGTTPAPPTVGTSDAATVSNTASLAAHAGGIAGLSRTTVNARSHLTVLPTHSPTAVNRPCPACSATLAPPPPVVAPPPFLFSYALDNHLKIGGGYFTVDRDVHVYIRYDTGRVQSAWWVTAHPHPITPGGAIYTDTGLIANCPDGPAGYIQAYDQTTQYWSNRLPTNICAPPANGISATAH